MNLHNCKLKVNENNVSLEGMLVRSSVGWRGSTHLTSTATGFFNGLVKLSDDHVVLVVPTVSNQVLPFNHQALPLARTSTHPSSNFVFDRRFLLPSEVVNVNIAIWRGEDCTLGLVARLFLGCIHILHGLATLGLESILPGVMLLQRILEVVHFPAFFISGLVVAHHGLELLQLSSLLSQLFSLLPVYLLFEYQVVFPDLVVPILEFITALHASLYLRFQLQNGEVTLSKFSSQGTEGTVFVLLF